MKIWQRSGDSKNWKQLNMNAKEEPKRYNWRTDKGHDDEEPQGKDKICFLGSPLAQEQI